MIPRFSIVTATRGTSPYLQHCAASVADQGLAEVEQVVVHKGPPPGALVNGGVCRLLAQAAGSAGLYGALNQGLAATQGDILAWLNDDEQYLPGTLDFVRNYFDAHPKVDLLFGDFLVVDAGGRLLAFRKGHAPRWPYILASHLYLFSCTLFFRRRVWASGLRFDVSFQSAGDMGFVARALRAGFRAAHVARYLAAFTWTGDNLSASAVARAEEQRLRAAAPVWVRGLRGPLTLARLLEKFFSGAYRQTWPLTYDLFLNDPAQRTAVTASAASWRWPHAAERGLQAR